MFKTNEYTYQLDFNKPGTIILDLTKKSKRNVRIRRFAPVALTIGGLYLIGEVKSELERRRNSDTDTETPTDV